MNTTAKIALAASGGYILGRTKKMKLAAMLALFLAGQKLPKSPLELVQQGAGALTKNEKFAELSQQVTGSLLDAGKVAASRSAERWLAGVSDKLREGIPTPGSGDSESADEPEDSGADSGQDSEQESGEEDTQSDENQGTDAQAGDEDSATDDDSDSEQSDSSEEPSTASKKSTSTAKKTGNAAKKTASSRSRSGRASSSSSQRSGSAKGA